MLRQRLPTSSETPSIKLDEKLGYKSSVQDSAVSSQKALPRVSLISLDDILNRLGPSLPKKNACSIIDLNPGVCLWSSKIHELLQPRRHLLVERDFEAYKPYIEPLIGSRGSRYKHVSTLTEVTQSESLLLEEYEDGATQPGRDGFNPSLLIIANLTTGMSKTFADSFVGSSGKYQMHGFYTSLCEKGAGVHKFGLARLLAWMPDGDKLSILPRSVAARSKQSIEWDTVADVREVTGGTCYQVARIPERRMYALDLESSRDTEVKATEQGIDTQLRRPPQPARLPGSYDPKKQGELQELQKSPYKPAWIDQLLRLEEMDQDGTIGKLDEKQKTRVEAQVAVEEDADPLKYDGLNYKVVRMAKRNHELGLRHSLERRKLRVLQNTSVAQYNKHMKIVQISEDVRKLERLSRKSSLHRDVDADQKEILELRAKVDTERAKFTREKRLAVNKHIDDIRAFDQAPPVLPWDRRVAEPLLATSEEFYPRKTLTLLDVMPRPVPNLSSRLDTLEKQICFEHVLSVLLRGGSRPITNALRELVPGGLEQFLERVPSLRDPAKGGSPDLSDLRSRSLPSETFVDLALAFESWPFRPDIASLRSKQNDSLYEP